MADVSDQERRSLLPVAEPAVVDGMVLPVGRSLWGALPAVARAESPMPRRTEA